MIALLTQAYADGRLDRRVSKSHSREVGTSGWCPLGAVGVEKVASDSIETAPVRAVQTARVGVLSKR